MQTKSMVVALLVAILLVTLGGIASAKSFDDVPRSHWAYDAVDYLASKGLIEGFGDGTYRGNKEMTRYELAMLIARAYARLEEMSDKEASIDVEAIMNDLMDEFEDELADIRDLIKSGQVRLDDLERKTEENSKANTDLAAKLDQLGSKFKFNGQMKLRLDGKWFNPGSKRFIRPRISFRFDMAAPVNDEVTFKARLGTGGVGTRQGSETTLTNMAGIKEFDLERAVLIWKPEEWSNWTFQCGKFPPNWETSAQFIDTDVNFEGLSESYKADNWVVNLAQLTPADKGGYLVGQVGATDLFLDKLNFYLTYHYLSSGAFETMYTAFPYWFRLDADDYSAIEALASYSFMYENLPIALEAAYRLNLADEWATYSSGLQEAATATVKFGKIKEIHDWDAYIFWNRQLPNSLIPQFMNISAGWGGCDAQIIGGGVGYKLQDYVVLRAHWYHAENLVANSSGGWDYGWIDIITDF
ncbi:MAG: putative porin [bacterium]